MVTLAEHIVVAMVAVSSIATTAVYASKSHRRKAVIDYQDGVIERQKTSLEKMEGVQRKIAAYIEVV